jgi:phage pi2 protein 07
MSSKYIPKHKQEQELINQAKAKQSLSIDNGLVFYPCPENGPYLVTKKIARALDREMLLDSAKAIKEFTKC